MQSSIVREAELRRAVIDRLIDASVTVAQATRDADLARWRGTDRTAEVRSGGAD